MDTKWKGFNFYNGLKVIIILLMMASVLVIIPSADYIQYYSDQTTDNYNKTFQFENRFNDLLHNVVEYNVILKNEEHIRTSSTNSYIDDEIYQRPSDLEYINEEINNDIEYKLNRLHTIEDHLENNVNFIYYIEDTKTNESFTNIENEDPVDFIKKQDSYVFFNQYKSDNNSNFNYNDDIMRMLKGTDYEVHGAVYKSLRLGDDFFIENAQFNQYMKDYPNIRMILIAASILFLLTFALIIKLIGRDQKGNLIDSSLDRIYNEIQIIFALVAIVFTEVFVNMFYIQDNVSIFSRGSISTYIEVGIYINILLLLLLSFIRQYKNKKLTKNTITYELVKLCFKTKYFRPGIIIIFTAYVFINAVLGVILLATLSQGTIIFLFAFSVFTGFNVIAFIFLLRSLQSLNKIMEVTKQVSYGNFENIVNQDQISLSFRDFYNDIISIKDGMKNAVQEAIKGERLKTELITNVSHDLKTPLTSIINYVDLLKREKLEGENATDYVKVLEEKSARLKQLIDDLLEASKASSGNLNVEFQELDLNELILQAVGECEDKFVDANLEVRVNTLEESIPIFGDSKHMWRIAENILTNAIKYAMPHTRIYIDTRVEQSYGIITMKNVSAQPLDISPEQLTQRFVRGDESRTTEGSGLGLSIAESLTHIQNGKFTIDIDGDLFKVTVYIPLAIEDIM
ncbi:GHKL domain-containing protein [Alkalibaculum sp. M08DMB]|uniref:histidine kinase n=1 Tax=Alkalibaculum sporogenes TaxID=2655001 RepID=A0A6A7KAT7_9FIRM|nr:HAMP domain-containing sensor histidine kinase [Alkalibaculum sporogenes]MPW26659.1 GHKL domain-containing protein [Alkalibaculum sporogenes]